MRMRKEAGMEWTRFAFVLTRPNRDIIAASLAHFDERKQEMIAAGHVGFGPTSSAYYKWTMTYELWIM